MNALFRVICVICLMLTIFYITGCSKKSVDNVNVYTLECNADSLGKTIVAPYLGQQGIESGTNILWCATMQIAWNELCTLIGEDIHMSDEHNIIHNLNKKGVSKNDLDKQTYIAAAGFGNEVIEEVNKQIADIFRSDMASKIKLIPNSTSSMPPSNDLISYSFLFSNLQFEWSFDRLNTSLNFDNIQVESFGIDQYLRDQKGEAKAASQVYIYDYRNEDDFIIELKTIKKKHRLFLAKVQQEKTLADTIKTVRDRISTSKAEPLKEPASLVIPVINFDVVKDYHELTNRPLNVNNPKFKNIQLDIAQQRIRFRLDEKGAVLESEAVFASGFGTDFIFNKPFLIMIDYIGSEQPYFALWVANSELLVPYIERITNTK